MEVVGRSPNFSTTEQRGAVGTVLEQEVLTFWIRAVKLNLAVSMLPLPLAGDSALLTAAFGAQRNQTILG
jgi:hypothetical protein